jgi:hypothetical protein
MITSSPNLNSSGRYFLLREMSSGMEREVKGNQVRAFRTDQDYGYRAKIFSGKIFLPQKIF